MKHYIGIDLGGTNTKIGVVDLEGNLIISKIIKTHSKQKVDKTLERIWETSKELLVKCDIPLFSVLGIGIGIPGPVKEQSIVGFFANFDLSTCQFFSLFCRHNNDGTLQYFASSRSFNGD